jgi:hypothetical protein
MITIPRSSTRNALQSSQPHEFQNFQKFLQIFFFNTPIDLYGDDPAPRQTRAPILESSQKSMLFWHDAVVKVAPARATD